MARDFVVTRPQEADAPRIAEIHLAAMDSNPLLHAQFPTPESLESLDQFLAAYTVEQLHNSTSGVLVARDPETGVVVGFAKWGSPSHPENVKLENGGLRYLNGCRHEFLDGYAARAEEAKQRCFGDRPCYCMCCRVFPNSFCSKCALAVVAVREHSASSVEESPNQGSSLRLQRSINDFPALPDSPSSYIVMD